MSIETRTVTVYKHYKLSFELWYELTDFNWLCMLAPYNLQSKYYWKC